MKIAPLAPADAPINVLINVKRLPLCLFSVIFRLGVNQILGFEPDGILLPQYPLSVHVTSFLKPSLIVYFYQTPFKLEITSIVFSIDLM